MVRYFYGWIPLLVVGTLVLLSLPWLGLIALVVLPLVVLGTLAWLTVSVAYALNRAFDRLWHGDGGASPQPALALAPNVRRNAGSATESVPS